ncbi:hypothetical protein CN638_17870 [Bacillus toyonensis]|nr:hypothetical protein CN638_17870 [Bacillus toyonensis]PEP80464.1 hypothetical protein CN581_15665 [Bacillus toyonensis]
MEQAKGKRIDVRGINIIVHIKRLEKLILQPFYMHSKVFINGGVAHAHQVNISYHPRSGFFAFCTERYCSI